MAIMHIKMKQRFIKNFKRDVYRSIAAVFAAVFLVVLCSFIAFAEVKEVSFVTLPEGFSHFLSNQEDYNGYLYSSKRTWTVDELKNDNVIGQLCIYINTKFNITPRISTADSDSPAKGCFYLLDAREHNEISLGINDFTSKNIDRDGIKYNCLMVSKENIINHINTISSEHPDREYVILVLPMQAGHDDSSSGHIYHKNNELSGAVITTAYPSAWGTTSGDTQSYTIQGTTIKATAKPGYVFDHWEKNGVPVGNKESMDVLCSGSIDAYVAIFKSEENANGVFTETEDSAKGSASGGSLRIIDGKKVEETTLTAKENRGYVFSHWTFIDGEEEVEVSTANPYTVKVRDNKDVYKAYFDEMWGVKTSASPIAAGYTSGDTDGFVNGQEVKQTTIQATLKSDEYVFSHWELKDGSIVSNSMSITVPIKREDGMVEYVAVFEKLSDAFGVTTQPDNLEHGSTTGDTLRKKDGQLIDQTTIQAIPASNEWVFDHWELSTNGGEPIKVSNVNPYNVKVKDQHDEYTAVFVWAFAADGVYTTVSDAKYGTTSGDSLRNANGQVVTQTTIEAFPSSNEWVFDYWEVQIPGETPVKVSIANPYTVSVDDCVYVYIANFRARNGKTNLEIEIKGHATGITDSVIKKKERLFTVPVLGVDRNYILQLAEQAVQESSSRKDIPPYAGDSPRLSALSAALQLQEMKNEEELKNTGFDFVTSDGEIINISDVPVTSAVSEVAVVAVEDKYGDIYNSEVIKVGDAAVPVTFNDGKRTVIWSNTGAQKDDRLMIIQQGMFFDDRNITPIADKDGNIVFSTSDFNGSRFILVKVGYK